MQGNSAKKNPLRKPNPRAAEEGVIWMVLSAVQPSNKLELITESQVQPQTPPAEAPESKLESARSKLALPRGEEKASLATYTEGAK